MGTKYLYEFLNQSILARRIKPTNRVDLIIFRWDEDRGCAEYVQTNRGCLVADLLKPDTGVYAIDQEIIRKQVGDKVYLQVRVKAQ